MKLKILFILLLILFSACSEKKTVTYPKHPNYAINKPTVQYKPTKKNLAKMVKALQGSPYVWAEEGPDKFDCSGFTYYMYGSMGIDIPRVARNQAKVGKRVSPDKLQYGDLIFFATSHNRRKITHVGMYLGEGWFTHASTVKHKVVYSNLFTSPYYKKRLRICRRYLPSSQTEIVSSQAQKPWSTKVTLSGQTKNIPLITQKESHVSEQHKAVVIKAQMQEIEQPSSDGHYYVQIGSFVGKPKNTLISQITRYGFHHKMIQFQKQGKQISKLLIGPYKTKTEASKVLSTVRYAIEKDAFIAEIR